MTRSLGVLLAVGAALFASACSDKTPGGDGCGGNAACAAGQVCVDGACLTLCRTDNDCDGQICRGDVCVDGTRTDVPEITAVDGDGVEDGLTGHAAHHVRRRLTVSGRHFEGAGVTLTGTGAPVALELCSATPEQLVVELPDGLTAGSYLLRVASQAGFCDATVPVLQGEAGPAGPEGDPGVPCSGCVDNATLAANAVTTDKIVDGGIQTNDLVGNAITHDKMADNAVGSTELIDGSIERADLAAMGCTAGQVLRRGASGWECYGGERCYSVTISNRSGTAWKFGRFTLPFGCKPPFLATGYPTSAPNTFGCTLEMWVEHHSGNSAGYWRGMRDGKMTIFPNGEGTGRAYMQIWDWGGSGIFDIEGGGGETLLLSHYADMCRFTDSYYNGSQWIQASPQGEGWADLGIMATSYTRCTLRFCEQSRDPGTHTIAERTSGPLTD